MGKILISDLDGTLLKHNETKLSDEILNSLKGALKKGITVCIASGRCYSELKEIFAELIDEIYFMPLDGSALIYKSKMLFHQYINKEIARNIIENARKLMNVECLIYGETQKTTDFSKILKISLNGEDIILKGKKLTSKYENSDVFVSYMNDNWYEIVAKGVNKGEALKKLCEITNINLENTIAFGDNLNDIEMLSYANESYAMQFSLPIVKQHAKKVINKNEIVKIINSL